jgi:hypothetical protein
MDVGVVRGEDEWGPVGSSASVVEEVIVDVDGWTICSCPALRRTAGGECDAPEPPS